MAREVKIQIGSREFIDWYFKLEDAHWILEDIKFTLNNRGTFKLEIEELFNQCINIPARLRIDYNSSKHRGEQYYPSQCILV